MKIRLLLLQFLFLSISFAQNYQTINSANINFFGNADSSYFLATRIDSIEVIGNDSVFYSFKTVRFNAPSTFTSTNCVAKLEDPWIGRKVILANNGFNMFINQDYDSIKINTLANIGDTFTMYSYPNGNWIRASVINIDTITIFNVIDSIKTYHLFSNDSLFQLPNTLQISKNHGFTELYPFYSFPNFYTKIDCNNIYNFQNINSSLKLVGSSLLRVGIYTPRIKDIYSLNIGDEYQHYHYGWDNNGSSTTYTNYLILDKIISVSQIQFQVRRSIGPMIDTLILSYNNPDSLITTYLPEEFQYANQYCFSYTKDSSQCNLTYNKFNISGGLMNDTCFGYPLDSYSDVYFYTIGANMVQLHNNWYDSGYQGGITDESNIIVGGDTCGNWYVLSVNEVEQIKFNIYPNPSPDVVQYTSNVQSVISISVQSITGELVKNFTNYPPNGKLSLGDLPKGIYLIKLSNEKSSVVRKLVLN